MLSIERIAKSLGGAKRTGNGWLCKCPSHEDGTASLLISGESEKIIVHCFAGCDFKSVRDCMVEKNLIPPHTVIHEEEKVKKEPNKEALAVWELSTGILGTPAELYLNERGYDNDMPEALRYIEKTEYNKSVHASALIACIKHWPSNDIYAIHRTYITHEGKKAFGKDSKKMLGPCKGGAIRLAMPVNELALCEGLETGLSIMQHAGIPVWVTMCADFLKNVGVPAHIEKITIFADNDANNAGYDAAMFAAERLRMLGHHVTVRMPPTIGTDYNDYYTNLFKETAHPT